MISPRSKRVPRAVSARPKELAGFPFHSSRLLIYLPFIVGRGTPRSSRNTQNQKQKAAKPACTGLAASVDTVSRRITTECGQLGVVRHSSTFNYGQLRAKSNLLGRNLCTPRQSILNFEPLDFSLASSAQ
jgi:hypothetical protein